MDRHVSLGIGIMQGRLSPSANNRIQAFPEATWQDEFPIAAELGFDAIEFIFDSDGADIAGHPLLVDECRGVEELVTRHSVCVRTICADYFMRHPIHVDAGVSNALKLLRRLLDGARVLGVTDIVLPCVDDSSLRTASDRDRLRKNLESLLPDFERARVNLALETDLGPAEFRDLLRTFDSPAVRVNYDTGNSAALGYHPVDEWRAYGDRVSSVHIKDRRFGGSTVPLGTGAVQFDGFFRVARDMGYRGLFVIQGARGEDDVAVAAQYRDFVRDLLARYYAS